MGKEHEIVAWVGKTHSCRYSARRWRITVLQINAVLALPSGGGIPVIAAAANTSALIFSLPYPERKV